MRMYWQLNHSSVRDTIPSLGLYAFASLILESSSQRGYCTLQHLETSVRWWHLPVLSAVCTNSRSNDPVEALPRMISCAASVDAHTLDENADRRAHNE